MAAPILNLDSLVDRQTVLINGQEYELLTTDLLPPLDAHRFGRYAQRIAGIVEKSDLTADEEGELEDLPKRMCRLVLQAPDAVHDNLTQQQRMAVVNTFISPPQPARQSWSEPTPARTPSNGANGSPDSSASTVATP